MSNTVINATISWQALEFRRDHLAQIQADLNARARESVPIADEIRAIAASAHAAYPQFEGRWDGWTLGKIRRRIETKAGVCFEPGDIVLVQPRARRVASFLPAEHRHGLLRADRLRRRRQPSRSGDLPMKSENKLWICIERRNTYDDDTYAMAVPTPTGGVVIRRGTAMVFVPNVDLEAPAEENGVGRLVPRNQDYRDA